FKSLTRKTNCLKICGGVVFFFNRQQRVSPAFDGFVIFFFFSAHILQETQIHDRRYDTLQQLKRVFNPPNTPFCATQHGPGVRDKKPEREKINTTGFPGRR
ncbi:hypothetical protein, partial [Enterobacter intestinihominis]